MFEKSCASWKKYGPDNRMKNMTGFLLTYLNLKTEREIVQYTIETARRMGAHDLTETTSAAPGDILYMNWKNRAVAVVRLGSDALTRGINAVLSHGDSPRIDIKERPLYEKDDLLFFDGHYYGGIKKYQWVNIPLALHGEVHTTGGETVHFVVGEEENDPVFTVPDIAIHLDDTLGKRTAKEAVLGEDLDINVGSVTECIEKENGSPIPEEFRTLIKKRYGLDERTLASADIAFVPAGKAREAGFDRSMIASYGLDDHICAAASWSAFLEGDESPMRTYAHIVMDKEEIGSDGISGADGAMFETLMLELLRVTGNTTDSLTLRRMLSSTTAISADVTCGSNPLYSGKYVRDQQPKCGNGVVLVKGSGGGGKYSASEARGEFSAAVISLFEREDIPWQIGSFGTIDKSGGGTLAKYIARLGADIIDLGPALLSMHSPLELASKADFVALQKAYKAFMEHMRTIR